MMALTPAERDEVDEIAAKDVANTRVLILHFGHRDGGLTAHLRYPQDTDRRYCYVACYDRHVATLRAAQKTVEMLTGDERL
jgi:hypothetical protein